MSNHSGEAARANIMRNIEYRYGNNLDLDDVIDLYRKSTLGERRPIDDKEIVSDMIKHANPIVSAWDQDLLVGISRTLTDFSFVGYLSDLAVRASHQRMGDDPEDERKDGTALNAGVTRGT